MQRFFYIFILVASVIAAPAKAQDASLNIVASFSILADVVQNVAGDRAEVTSLMPSGTDPHAFQPTPQDIASLAETDIVFINGVNFEESLIEVIKNADEEINMVVVSECIPILAGEAEQKESPDETIAGLCEAHHAEVAGLHGGEHPDYGDTAAMLYQLECGHHEGEHGSCDPHVWTNPENVILWTLFIRDVLNTFDPENAETYNANAVAYLEQLEALIHEELEPMIDSLPEEKRVLVTNHETLGYFAAAYDFEIAGAVITGSSSLAEPGAGDIARMIDTINELGITAIFAENTVSADLAQQIADETGAKFYTLYSDSLSEPDGPASTYLDYMRYNVETIVSALSE